MRVQVQVTLVAVLLLVAGIAGAGVAAAQEDPAESPCTGRIAEPAAGLTVVSLQGYVRAFDRVDMAKLVALGPRGDIRWIHESRPGTTWFYDVDPLPNGNLFVTASMLNESTLLFELNRTTGEREWQRAVPYHDSHDADLIADGERVLLGNMRNTVDNVSHDQLVIFDRDTGEEVWTWEFRNHYPHDTDDGVRSDDWTHLNDVDLVGGGYVLASPRDFDQVILVNRTSGEIVLQLGEDGQHDTLFQQHNPDYLETEGGDPTFLVSDSENDRAVEYTHRDGQWERTWAATGAEWPRDADRLPNGNTLFAVSGGHRVIEVTPEGEVVWEVHLPGSPYDVERIRYGDGSRGPTMADRDVSGSHEIHGGTGPADTERLRACQEDVAAAPSLAAVANGSVSTPIPESDDGELGAGTPVTPDGSPSNSSVPRGPLAVAGVVAALALLALVAYRVRD